jgi:hypothetical protein
VIRGDSGFCRDAIMRWCEENHVGYLLARKSHRPYRNRPLSGA